LRGYFDSPVAPDVRGPFEEALERLRRAGATIVDAELLEPAGILDAYVNIVLPEAASWHASLLDSRGGDYTPMVRARLESGRSIPATKYYQAIDFCRRLRLDVDKVLTGHDAIVLPTLPITAPRLGSDEITIDPAKAIARPCARPCSSSRSPST
jgi:aspartyl-tRNA(Asn)/glutamyl-tRNA(Gln) amidotransferase subunit A